MARASRRVAAAIVTLTMLVAPPALAETAGPASASDPPPRWYGWQMLLTDSVALVVTPLSRSAGVGLYVVGGPIVHLAHGNLERAGASLAGRVVLPLAVGAGVGFTADATGGDVATTGTVALVGAGIGAVAAMTLDAALLGEPRPRDPSTSSTGWLRPSGAMRKEGGFDLGIVGTW